MRLVLYEPDIPQNVGTLLRLAACFGVAVDIIEPCGFLLDDKRLKRAGMDYLDHVERRRHVSWHRYTQEPWSGRLLLLTTKGELRHDQFRFAADDRIMVGRESAGVPDDVAAGADARLRIPVRPECRSLNVALAAALVLGEALRQTELLPP